MINSQLDFEKSPGHQKRYNDLSKVVVESEVQQQQMTPSVVQNNKVMSQAAEDSYQLGERASNNEYQNMTEPYKPSIKAQAVLFDENAHVGSRPPA